MPKRPRVLIADDDPGLAKAVGRLLSLDCEVVGSVADGGALLEATQRLQPDVVVLDVNLPNVHGLEACRQITQLNPGMRVIVFTAMSELEIKDESIAAGATAFVSKMSSGELLSAIRRLCVDRG